MCGFIGYKGFKTDKKVETLLSRSGPDGFGMVKADNY